MTTSVNWLEAALEVSAQPHSTVVDGARIAYRVWDNPEATSTLMLVHGGAAHSHWWDPIASLLADGTRVIALDLSGHGESEWRDSYEIGVWAREVLAVSEEAAVGPVTFVGHSLGGVVVTFIAAIPNVANHPNVHTTGVIAVDALIAGHLPSVSQESTAGYRARRAYPTLDAGLARFRPVPEQATIPRILDHVGRRSLREESDGWTWKFDHRAFASAPPVVTPVKGGVRYAFIRAGRGLVGPDVRATVETAGGAYLELENAGHAPMLDYPLAFANAVREILAGWHREDGA